MSRLYASCASGISGNMMIGALLDYGVPFSVLEKGIDKLQLGNYSFVLKQVNKNGVGATYFDVKLHDVSQGLWGPIKKQLHGVGHMITNNMGRFRRPQKHHSHPPVTVHAKYKHGERRGYTEIKALIEASSLSDWVKSKSVEAFYHLGMAEATVHESTLEEVHFHEVGAIDCIIDIVGTMICLEYLGVTEVAFSTLHVGSGTVWCEHGLMQVPTPATEKLLAGIPYVSGNIKGELVTPTGATLVKTLGAHLIDKVEVNVEVPAEAMKIGVGAGSRDISIPNVLRVYSR